MDDHLSDLEQLVIAAEATAKAAKAGKRGEPNSQAKGKDKSRAGAADAQGS